MAFDSGDSGVELESLAALMGYVEARKGPWGVYGDVVWEKGRRGETAKSNREFKRVCRAKAELGYEITMAEIR